MVNVNVKVIEIMQIPYGKVAVYLLTFLGYIYSGYGSGILSNLRDAVLTAESVFGDVLHNAIKLAQKFKIVHDVFDAAVEEDCVFKCPNNAVPKPNRNHIPSADGCGSLGITINTDYLPHGETKKCCNEHDICYDTCGKNKEICDIEFKKCLYKYCDSYGSGSTTSSAVIKACKGTAKVLFTGTLTLGCKAYMDAQKKACYCPRTSKNSNRKRKYKTGADDAEL